MNNWLIASQHSCHVAQPMGGLCHCKALLMYGNVSLFLGSECSPHKGEGGCCMQSKAACVLYLAKAVLSLFQINQSCVTTCPAHFISAATGMFVGNLITSVKLV